MKNSFFASIVAALCIAGLVSCERFDTPASVSYTLIASFEDIVEEPLPSYFQDSLLFSQIFGLDQVVYLSTRCGETYNTDFSDGWKISVKKGSPSDDLELARFASAGNVAGVGGSKAYAAFSYSPAGTLMPEYDIRYSLSGYSKSSATVGGMYINNTLAVERLCLGGEVVKGDYLKVIAHEFLSDKEIGTQEIMLVDYTGDELKYINEWTAWEFGNKENLDDIKFEVVASSSKFPLGFCMDYFVTSISIDY